MTRAHSIRTLLQNRYGIIGSSDGMMEAKEQLAQVAPTNLTVLITGETGTGKEVFAHALHGLSDRKKSPFVSVNCGAIPETLLESELFGHEKGAFTGATEQRKGFFEVADRGTIFLDEIGEMPFGTQVKLLRVLESGEFTRLGSTAVQKVDVRVVGATNRDLEYEVRRGNFRQDLFFRLNTVQIHLPPLRRHPEDVPELAAYFAAKVCERQHLEFRGFDDDAMRLLQHHPWRGNVRELRNLIETVVTIGQGARVTADQVRRYLTPQRHDDEPETRMAIVHVPQPETPPNIPTADAATGLVYQSLLRLQHDVGAIKQAFSALVERLSELTIPPPPSAPTEPAFDPAHMRLDDMEKMMIAAALKHYHGSRRQAARSLGLSERTLYRKMQQYDIDDEHI
ncbi:MAG: sigma-54 interaction domain-containing protein [Candidatus Kapaibacterium sp.]